MLYVGARNKQLKQETPCDARFDVEPSGFQMPFVTTPIMTAMVCALYPQAALPLWLPPLRRTREHVTAQPLLGPPSVLGKLPPGLEWECGPQLAFFCVWDAGYDYGSDSGSGVSMWPCARKASLVHCHMEVCLLRQTHPGLLKTRGPGFL